LAQLIFAMFVYCLQLRMYKANNVNVAPIYWFARENISSRAFPIFPPARSVRASSSLRHYTQMRRTLVAVLQHYNPIPRTSPVLPTIELKWVMLYILIVVTMSAADLYDTQLPRSDLYHSAYARWDLPGQNPPLPPCCDVCILR